MIRRGWLATGTLAAALTIWSCGGNTSPADSSPRAGDEAGARTPAAARQDTDAGGAVPRAPSSPPSDIPDTVKQALPGAAYAIVDLTTSRTTQAQRAEWLDQPVAAGSIAKIATFVAAIDAGVLTPGTRLTCTRSLKLRDGRDAACAHAPFATPIDPVTALAESCNTFAATLARRMPRARLSAAQVALGLPAIDPSDDVVAAAIGLGRARVSPRRLLDVLRRGIDGDTLVRDGLARAADSGTASAFTRAGLEAFAKTSTSTMTGGRSLGLVVALVPRTAPSRGIVVMLPGGTGRDAAQVAAALLTSGTTGPDAARAGDAAVHELEIGVPRSSGDGYDVEKVALEDYVARVVAGETTASTPPAVRDALAVAARTFALVNRDRHATEGFDLCTLTHCQVTRPADAGARESAVRTAGQVLAHDGGLVPVFYSAACGGSLEDARTLAAARGPWTALPWVRERRDPAAVDEPAWSSSFRVDDLERALRGAGWKGSGLRGLRAERSAAGRVRRVHAEGLEPSQVPVADFRRAVGTQLGWQHVKSTAFSIERTSEGFRFRGRGAGHGAGLCVFGASALAERGWTAERILDTYFEGLRVVTIADLGSSTRIELQVPESGRRDVAALRRDVARWLQELSRETGRPAPPRLRIVMHPTVASYQRTTGREWWTSAATVMRPEPVIHTLPPGVLRARGQLESTIRHELVHVLLDEHLRDQPLWMREGVAVRLSGERLEPLEGPCPADAELTRPADRRALVDAYRRASWCVDQRPPLPATESARQPMRQAPR